MVIKNCDSLSSSHSKLARNRFLPCEQIVNRRSSQFVHTTLQFVHKLYTLCRSFHNLTHKIIVTIVTIVTAALFSRAPPALSAVRAAGIERLEVVTVSSILNAVRRVRVVGVVSDLYRAAFAVSDLLYDRPIARPVVLCYFIHHRFLLS